MSNPIIVLAGASGDLGMRIAASLISRGATVRALVRPSTSSSSRSRLTSLGAELVEADLTTRAPAVAACEGASCVVSALNGLRDVILDCQSVLIDAAVEAGVPRFISSDYSEDFTTTSPGHNRNLDLRREFMGRADRAPIRVTSILNGAFLDMLGAEMPILQPKIRSVLYFGSADQPLNFTSRADTAEFTAAAALDDDAPRILRIAGDTVTARGLARIASSSAKKKYRARRVGSVGGLSVMAAVAKGVAPKKPDPVFPAWQGMAYMVDMFSGDGAVTRTDNDRYPGIEWTSAKSHLDRLLAE